MSSITSSFLIPTLINISTSLLMDIFKEYKNRTRLKTLCNEINKFIDEFKDTELDSGSFIDFLSHPNTLRDFTEYIDYSTFRKMQSNKKIKFMLDKDTFTNYLSQQAVNFVEKNVQKNINFYFTKKYFDFIIDIIEKKLISTLTAENVGVLYFINNSLHEMEKRIISNFEINEYSNINEDFEKVKSDYLKILRARNKKSHVYGIDELELYSFYVFPEFYVNEVNGQNTKYSNEADFAHLKENISISEPIKWIDLFKESNMVSVIGGAGFGKSLFLKNVINKFSEMSLHNSDKLIPIYCDLKQFKINSQMKSSYSIEDFLVDSIIYNTGLDSDSITKNFLRYFLKAGRCLILFDALDEVEKEDRQYLNELISSFFEVTNKHNKIIITSRGQGFIPKTRIVYDVCKVNIKQIKDYLLNMIKLKQFNAQNMQEFLRQSEILIQNGFLTSLLTVSLLVQIYKAEKELPENKIDLYEKCVDYISKKREKDQKKSNFNFKLMSNILDHNISFEKLAWLARPNNIEIEKNEIKEYFIELYKESYSSENETRNAIDEFLQFCTQRTELYVAGNKEEYYKFYHRSFYEFFYSKCIINEFRDNSELFEELQKFGYDSEMFELTTALLKKHDYSRFKLFIKYLFDQISPQEEFFFKENEEKFFRICIILNAADQIKYRDKIYNYFFDDKRILDNLGNSLDASIISILFKSKNEMSRNLEEDIIKFYPNELLVIYLVSEALRMPRNRFRSFKMNMIFFHIRNILDKSIVNSFISEVDDETLYSLAQDHIYKEEDMGQIEFEKHIKLLVNRLRKRNS
ncbi:NACHT domain-containing protein [Paenibacillus sp. PsM32]|uniref:NACHT domain-containing protein n=1 Tax=Paenibacillus sp. PsM32 TaxID=3030536 RepID=UPI00263AFD28|nr:NACHT domain-containing protein [Paenibacillus sp. PsM32]MDN4616826.1 NACHT domain-containing protein [Paenibacillus sp. PsM32]